jgi:hypothetical protein
MEPLRVGGGGTTIKRSQQGMGFGREKSLFREGKWARESGRETCDRERETESWKNGLRYRTCIKCEGVYWWGKRERERKMGTTKKIRKGKEREREREKERKFSWLTVAGFVAFGVL